MDTRDVMARHFRMKVFISWRPFDHSAHQTRVEHPSSHTGVGIKEHAKVGEGEKFAWLEALPRRRLTLAAFVDGDHD